MNSGRGNTREGSEDSKKKFDRHSLFVVNVRVGSSVVVRRGKFYQGSEERRGPHETETPIKIKN